MILFGPIERIGQIRKGLLKKARLYLFEQKRFVYRLIYFNVRDLLSIRLVR